MVTIKRTINLSILIPAILFIILLSPVKLWANDPFGVVFDSVSNQAIDGATVTLERLITETDKWELAVVGTDVISPAGVTNPQISGWTGNPGEYQFGIALGGYVTKTFRIKVQAQTKGYLFPSTFTSAQIQAQWPARHLGDNTVPPPDDDPDISWGQQFDVTADDNWWIDMPVDYCQPDVQIKKSGATSYQGDGVYNSTGTNQSASQSPYINNTVTYYIKIENDGTITTTFTVTMASQGSWSGFAKFFDALTGGNDITQQIIMGTWTINNLVSGSNKEIRVEVTPGSVVTRGTTNNLMVSALAQLDSNITDTVKAATTAYHSVQAGSSGDDDDDSDGWDNCGLIGLEALLLIFIMGLLRRRKFISI